MIIDIGYIKNNFKFLYSYFINKLINNYYKY